MLEGILGRGFSSKCKSLLKQTKNRIEVIRRKRKATLKFLRKDIADLLANGLDVNAFGRADGLLAETTLSECYQYIDNLCEFVLRHLSVLEKINHCPEDCREAVSSLMFAAARFSDLPELRDLRQIFSEKYENSLELYANKQFLENLSSESVTLEKKIQLMENIASEFSINWDPESYMKKINNPPQVCSKMKKGNADGKIDHLIKHSDNDRMDHCSEKENDFSRLKPASKFNHHFCSTPENQANSDFLPSVKQETKFRQDFRAAEKLNLQERHDFGTENHGVYGRSVSDIEGKRVKYHDLHIKDSISPANSSHRNRVETVEREKSLQKSSLKHEDEDHSQSWRNGSKNDEQKLRESHRCPLPPPYTKPNPQAKARSNRDLDVSQGARSNDNLRPDKFHDSCPDDDDSGRPPRRRSSKERERVPQDPYYGKPDSKRRHGKSRPNNDHSDKGDEGVSSRRKSRGRRRDGTRQGLQILSDDDPSTNDEEERIIDKLLLHYSKKPSASDHVMLSRQRRQGDVHVQVETRYGKNVVEEMTMAPAPPRSSSLPHDQIPQPGKTKTLSRAATFDGSSTARHVHPKLPDYDDLAAKFTALKGR